MLISRYLTRQCLRRCLLWLLAVLVGLPASLSAESMLQPLHRSAWANLKNHAEQQTSSPVIPLSTYLSTEYLLPALPLRPLLSPDGAWVYYWRRQGLQYWLLRTEGNGEEQVLHKQRDTPPYLLTLSADQQHLWLAAPDLLQILDIRRKTLRTIWRPGFALPGQKQVPPRQQIKVVELNAEGAVLQWQQRLTTYWLVKANHAAQQVWPDSLPAGSSNGKQAFWRDSQGQALFAQYQTPRSAAKNLPAEGLRPQISEQLVKADGQVVATARLYERLYWHSQEAGWQTLLDQLQAWYPSCSMQLQSAADTKRLLVSFACSDQINAQYRLLTINEHQQIQQHQTLALTAQTPQPAGAQPLQIAWQSTDQQTIPGYLYLPTGRPLAESPLVTLIHGGPFSRTDPTYDGLVQWLVNRGMIVLQPDYRSSSGYGQAFMQAARGDFDSDNPALNDVLSGIRHLLANGIGDPAQLAVVGHSFGGYLSIQALQAQPLQFRFALALAAPVDLAATLATYLPTAATPFGQKPLAQEFNDAGVPWQDLQWQQHHRSHSPQARLALQQRPLYLWGGAKDDRIAAAALLQFQQQAIAQGKTVRLWLDPDSGHQPGTLQSRRLQFYLAANLIISHLQPAQFPGDASPAVSGALAADLEAIDHALQQLEVSPASAGN